MAEVTRCPTCGNVLSGALGGRCPECMLQAGLAGSSEGASEAATVDYDSRGGAAAALALSTPGKEFGNYHLVRALGEGGMGKVFEAEDRETGRRLALKVLSHSLDSGTARQRFLREGRLAASVNHPHCVYVFGTEEIDGSPVITMELVRGGTLQDRVRGKGPMPVADAVDAVLQIIDGLEAAEAVGVLHRDIKPSNCFVDAEGQVKIGDFGLSISKSGRGGQHLTTSGVLLGTPAFSSPEQLRGDELDQRSDQYAVGVTLFYLLTGKVPFDAKEMMHLVATVLEKPAPDVRSLRPEVPRELALLVHRCLEKQPNRRYKNYADLRGALLPFSSFVPIPANPATRFAAGLVDFALLAILVRLSSTIMAALGQAPTPSMGIGRQLADMAPEVALWFLYYILPEGLAGISLGKWLLRLRVVRLGTMHPPGIGRAALRTLFYELVPSLPGTFYVWINRADFVDAEGHVDLADPRIWYLLLACLTALPLWVLLFSTMRGSNGFAGVHDLISGARVIFRPKAVTRPVTTLASQAVEPVQPGTTCVGPYHLLSQLGVNNAGEWHLGYDSRLLRKVWIRVVPAGTPPVPASVRHQTRAGRLRWLTGRRGPGENWDAFEAPGGQSLWSLLDKPRDWGEIRYWLLDLSEELSYTLRDGTLPTQLGLDRAWITAEGRAKLLDLPAPGLDGAYATLVKTAAGAVDPVRAFLQQVAASGLRGRRLEVEEAQKETFTFPLPLHARPILEGLSRIQRPEVLHEELEQNLDKAGSLTQARRWAPLATSVAIAVSLAILSLAQQFQTIYGSAEPSDAVELKESLFRHTPPFGIGKSPDAKEKEALEIYITGRFGERIKDHAFWEGPYVATHIRPTHEKIAKEIVQNTPLPSVEALEKARAIVHPGGDSHKGLRLGFESPILQVLVLLAGSLLGGLLLVAVSSIVCALMFRGGLMWRLFGVAAVMADGRTASRLRLTWRSLVAWSPLLVPFLAPIPISLVIGRDGTLFPYILAPLALAALAAVVASALSARSWPDRLAGTWLVAR